MFHNLLEGLKKAGLPVSITEYLALIEAVGLMAAAVVALQISETIVEEEILRDAHQSAPTRVRRFLSRFFVVVVVALAIEGLVATFKALHEDMASLGHAAALIGATALLLAAWGVFVFLNRSAEELEPEAMERAKAEDEKVEHGGEDEPAEVRRGRRPPPPPASRSR